LPIDKFDLTLKKTKNKTKGLKLHRHDLSIKNKEIYQKYENIPKNLEIYPKVQKYTKKLKI